MTPDKSRRLVLLPVLTANIYSIYGVLFMRWDVADIFFWFWSEFILAGVTAFVLLLCWLPFEKKIPRQTAKMMPYFFAFSFLMILLYTTLFTAMAYHGEWGTYACLPEFLADKWAGLLAMLVSYAVLLVLTLLKPARGSGSSNGISKSFNRKCVMVAAFYILFLIHGWIREWTTGAHLQLTPEYLKAMGAVLLLLKSLTELGLLDPPFRRQNGTGKIDPAHNAVTPPSK